MIVLNFSHPLTPEHVAQIEALTGRAVERVVEIPVHLDTERPFGPQIAEWVEKAGLPPAGWQTFPLLVVPPALNFAAVLLIAELHGRMGYFPPCVRIKPVPGVPPRYEVAEILDLQGQREAARERRRE